MNKSSWRLVIVTVLAASAFVVAMGGKPGASSPAVAGPASANAGVLPAAEKLHIQVQPTIAGAEGLLDPAASAWNKAIPTALLLSRTPRIYQTEPIREYPVPRCEVRALRTGGKLMLRLLWDDKTRNAPEVPASRDRDPSVSRERPQLASRERPESASRERERPEPAKRPTNETSSFPDAAAVMIPDAWTGPGFPSLLMGDKHAPAHLYYWNASRGVAELTASGRATPQPTGQKFPFRARHTQEQWALTMEVPDQRDGYPVAFAIWDGQSGDRDGLKFFSIWYVLTGK